jgi:hypothetical protein
MSIQSPHPHDPKAMRRSKPNTHTYRLFRLLKSDVAEQREPRIIQIEEYGSTLSGKNFLYP